MFTHQYSTSGIKTIKQLSSVNVAPIHATDSCALQNISDISCQYYNKSVFKTDEGKILYVDSKEFSNGTPLSDLHIVQAYYANEDDMKKVFLSSYDELFYLEKLYFSDSIKSIPSYFFQNCDNLRTLILPYGLSSIGYNAFKMHYKLENIVIPVSLVDYQDNLFSSTPAGCKKYFTFNDEMDYLEAQGNHCLLMMALDNLSENDSIDIDIDEDDDEILFSSGVMPFSSKMLFAASCGNHSEENSEVVNETHCSDNNHVEYTTNVEGEQLDYKCNLTGSKKYINKKISLKWDLYAKLNYDNFKDDLKKEIEDYYKNNKNINNHKNDGDLVNFNNKYNKIVEDQYNEIFNQTEKLARRISARLIAAEVDKHLLGTRRIGEVLTTYEKNYTNDSPKWYLITEKSAAQQISDHIKKYKDEELKKYSKEIFDKINDIDLVDSKSIKEYRKNHSEFYDLLDIFSSLGESHGADNEWKRFFYNIIKNNMTDDFKNLLNEANKKLTGSTLTSDDEQFIIQVYKILNFLYGELSYLIKKILKNIADYFEYLLQFNKGKLEWKAKALYKTKKTLHDHQQCYCGDSNRAVNKRDVVTQYVLKEKIKYEYDVNFSID